MSGLVGIGEGLSGFAEGISAGYGIASESKERKLREKLSYLQKLKEEKELYIEEEKRRYEMEQDNFDNSLTLLDKYLKGYRPVANTSEGKRYIENISNMPFLKSAPEEIKLFSEAMMSQSGDNIKMTSTILDNYLKSKKNNDRDGMAQAFFQGMSIFGKNPPEGVKRFFDVAKEDLFPKKASQPSLSGIGKLISEQQQYSPESKEYQLYEEAKAKSVKGPSTEINIDLGKSAKNQLQKNLIEIDTSITGLEEARTMLTPEVTEFLSVPGQAKALSMDLKRKFGIKSSDSKEEAYDKYLDFSATYLQTMAEEIHRLYGAALTATEERRVASMFPNINTESGWKRFLKTDSGKTFIKKLDSTINHMNLISDRYKYALKNGTIILDDNGQPKAFLDENNKSLSLKSMQKKESSTNNIDFIRSKFKELNPSLNDEQIDSLVNEFLQQEGIYE